MKRIIFFVIVSLAMISGCKKKPVTASESHYYHDSTIIKEKLVPVPIPGSSVVQEINYDSIYTLLKNYSPGSKTVYIQDPTNSTKLSFYIDQFGRLSAKCETLNKEYQVIVEDKERIIREKDTEIIELKKTFGQQIKDLIKYGLAGMGLLFSLLVVVLVILYRLKLFRSNS